MWSAGCPFRSGWFANIVSSFAFVVIKGPSLIKIISESNRDIIMVYEAVIKVDIYGVGLANTHTDPDEMSNLYRGPSIAATYQVSVHLTKRFQRRRFFMNRPITLKRNYGSVFLTQNYELKFSFNVIITITYSTL
jgi:hypothetical protein